MVCWNDVGRIRLTGSRAQLACSYFVKVQPSRPDFTHQNRTQVNAYHLLLSSFVHCHVWVKVNSLAFMIQNFRPYSSKFVSQHVAAAAISLQQKNNTEKKGKQIRRMKKRKQTVNGKTPGSEQPVVKSVCGSLTMRRRAASATIVRHWMHKLTFKLEGIKDQERSTLHEHCIKIAQEKNDPSQTDGAQLEKSFRQQQREKMILRSSECPC